MHGWVYKVDLVFDDEMDCLMNMSLCVCFDMNWYVLYVNWCLNGLVGFKLFGKLRIWSIERIDTPFLVLNFFWTKALRE